MVTLSLAATTAVELAAALDALTRRSTDATPTGPGLASRRVIDTTGIDVPTPQPCPVVELAARRRAI